MILKNSIVIILTDKIVLSIDTLNYKLHNRSHSKVHHGISLNNNIFLSIYKIDSSIVEFTIL